MSVSLQPVTTAADRLAFVRLPRLLCPAGSPWVRPLDSVALAQLDPCRNPYFRHADGVAYLAVRDGRPVGRVLAHHNRRYPKLHDNAAFFGFFDTIDDEEVATALLAAAADYGRSVGAAVLRGPLSLTASQEMGVIIDGFDHPPAFAHTYTPPHHARLLERAGFRPCFHMRTSHNPDLTALDARALVTDRHREAMRELGLTVRVSSRRTLPADLEEARDLINAGFLGQPHFVPITPEEWAFQMGPGVPYLDPDLILFAEVRGAAVGVLLGMPDFNRLFARMDGSLWHPVAREFFLPRITDHAVILIAALHRAWQGLGIGRLLYAALLHHLQRRGYRAVSGTWIAAENVANQRQVEALGMRPWHETALMESRL